MGLPAGIEGDAPGLRCSGLGASAGAAEGGGPAATAIERVGGIEGENAASEPRNGDAPGCGCAVLTPGAPPAGSRPGDLGSVRHDQLNIVQFWRAKRGGDPL